MKLLLLDDHTLFRKGLILLIQELDPDAQVVETGSANEALSLPESVSVDLVLLDLHLAGEDGLLSLNALRAKYEAPVVILSSEDDPVTVRHCIDQGASGFIPKSSTPKLMIAAMQLILAGGIYLPPAVLETPPDHTTEPNFLDQSNLQTSSSNSEGAGPLSHLTQRQIEVLKKAIQGKANKVIARELDLSEATVKAHMSSAYRSLGVKNRSEAVFTAARLGLRVN